MKLTPLNDHVLIKPLPEERSAGGIVLQNGDGSDTARGEIVATSEGYYTDSGSWIPQRLKVGDRVMYFQRSVTKMRIAGEDRILARSTSLIGVIEYEPATH